MMKNIFLLISFVFLGVVYSNAQTVSVRALADSLKYAGKDAFDCHAVTWRIIAQQKNAIDVLIEKLDDTTMTKARTGCKSSPLRVGDLAFLCLEDIVSLPFAAVTGMQCDVIDTNGCHQGVFEYIENNRTRFKSQVKNYCAKRKGKWIFRNFVPGNTPYDACRKQYHITGYYE